MTKQIGRRLTTLFFDCRKMHVDFFRLIQFYDCRRDFDSKGQGGTSAT